MRTLILALLVAGHMLIYRPTQDVQPPVKPPPKATFEDFVNRKLDEIKKRGPRPEDQGEPYQGWQLLWWLRPR